nr:hypothetical protein [Tanacetum cinerariifolium]
MLHFVENFLGTVRFGNNDFAMIAGYGDGLEVAFRKSTWFVRNEDGVDFLAGDRSSNLYTIALNDIASNSSACLLAKASSLPKMKFKKDHLCSACEQGKIHQKHHKSKMVFALNKPLYLLQIDLCGPMRVKSINEKRYVLVVVDDYSSLFYTKSFDYSQDFDKTPYELINKREPNIKFFHVFGCRCYLLNDYEDVGKLKAKGDIGVFVRYSKESASFRIYNKHTCKEKIFICIKEKITKSSITNVETSNNKIHSLEGEEFHEVSESFQEESSSSSLNDDVQQNHVYALDKALYDLKQAPRACDMVPTLMVEQAKLKLDLVGKPVDHTNYRSMIGSLMYLTSSRADIMFARCLWYPKDSSFDLTAYSDADHEGCHLDRKTKSEYVDVSCCRAQVLWMRTILTDYDLFYDKVTIYCDSKSAIAILCNPVQHTRTKHIDVRYHFLKDHVEKETIELHFVVT